MDTLRGNFDSSTPADDSQDWGTDSAPEQETVRELPPEAIGQDERRMQVRAYNHWASLLGDATYPSIEDLEPHNLTDFGPNSVLLDFSAGIDDPVVQYLGHRLAEECGTDIDNITPIERLSDVPPRSLLSRITDHYMQILANQAPIGFEAEFVNQRGSTILYRGILLPFSSDDETIDFIYGVINWKEMADAATADELLLEIDQAIEAGENSEDEVEDEDQPHKHHADALTEWADSPASEPVAETQEPEFQDVADIDDEVSELSSQIVPAPDSEPDFEPDNVATIGSDDAESEVADDLPFPDFGQYGLDDDELDEFGEPIHEEEEGAGYSFASLSDHIDAPAKKAIDLDADRFDPDDYRVDHEEEQAPAKDAPEADNDEVEVAEDTGGIIDPLDLGGLEEFVETAEDSSDTAEAQDEAPASEEPEIAASDTAPEAPVAPEADEEIEVELGDDASLHDCLAAARELAQTARVSEDRTRHALYAAVGRAYDFSLAAKDEPQAYEDLIEDSGLTVQDRAPMTPIVKLVFGHDYDKTRLTEYAAALTHAHRIGLGRGALADYLSEADGGLKGVVAAERRLRREEAGKEVEAEGDIRAQLAKKLRELEELTLEALAGEGPEFSLVMLRRDGNGNVALIGEIADDVKLIERAGKRLVR